MDVLGSWLRNSLADSGRILLASAFFLASACLLADSWRTEPATGSVFNHQVHVEEWGLDCSLCHGDVTAGEEVGMPVLDQCQLCHEDMDAEKPEELRAASLFDAAGQLRSAVPAAEDVVFSHQQHVVGYGLDCAACHGDIGASESMPADTTVTMSQCMECHASAGLENQCSECHTTIDQDWAPPSHDAAWEQLHGAAFQAHASGLQNQCSLCHAESSCDACHHERAPRDHTNYWRRRGHGVMVSLDRSRCMTCHQSDFCNRCHEDTRPLTHTGGFGSPRNMHCVSCHFPLQGESCFTCHKATPSHDLATPLPPDHNPSFNCRQCHGMGQPLPHPDKGDSCIACHR